LGLKSPLFRTALQEMKTGSISHPALSTWAQKW